MPLCTDCRSEAEVTGPFGSTGGERTDSHPPHGMDWGTTCDRCGQTAEVSV